MTKKFDKKNLTKKAAPIRNAPVPEILCTDTFCNFKIKQDYNVWQCEIQFRIDSTSSTSLEKYVFALKTYQILRVSAKS